MARIYLVISVLALSIYSWAQYRGIGLFDDEATTPLRGSSARTTFHK